MKCCAFNNFGGFVLVDVGRDVAEAEAEVEADGRFKDVSIAFGFVDGVFFLFVTSRKYSWKQNMEVFLRVEAKQSSFF